MLKRFSISFGGRLLSAAIQFFVVATYVRTMGVSTFGHYSVVVSVCFIALSVVELGMGTRILRGLEAPQARPILATYSIIRFSTFAVALSIASAYPDDNTSRKALAIAATLYTFGEAFGDFSVGIFQGQKKSKYAAGLLVSRRLTALLPLLMFNGNFGMLASMLTAGILGSASFAYLALKLRSKPAPFKSLISSNLTLMLTSGAMNLTQIDSALVGGIGGVRAAGFYGAASRLMNPINIAISTFLQVAIPELSTMSDFESKRLAFRKIRRYTLYLSGVLIAGSFFAPWAIIVIFGEEFRASGDIGRAVFIAAALACFTQVHLAWFYSTGMPWRATIHVWVAVLGGLACLAVLTAYVGSLGSAIGLVSINALLCIAVVSAWRFEMRGYGKASDIENDPGF